jgi:hypothetical protein
MSEQEKRPGISVPANPFVGFWIAMLVFGLGLCVGNYLAFQQVPNPWPWIATLLTTFTTFSIILLTWQSYRDRNVLGYERVHMRPDETDETIVYPRLERPYGTYRGKFVLCMPLGGWFARPHLRDAKTGRVNRAWRLRKYEEHEMSDGMKYVRVRDRAGNTAVMPVSEVIKLFMVADSRGDFNLGDLLIYYFRESEALKLEAIRHQLESADAYKLLLETEYRLAKTNRIKDAIGPVKSKEAKALLQWLREERGNLAKKYKETSPR